MMNEIDKISEAIRWALEEADRCKDDSIQDIWNEAFEKWDVKLMMRHGSYIVDKAT